MTETCTAVTMFPVSQRIGTFGSAGQLVPGCIAKVVKEDGVCDESAQGADLEAELYDARLIVSHVCIDLKRAVTFGDHVGRFAATAFTERADRP